MPWKCPVCGAENPDDADRCLQCGAPRPAEGEALELPPPPSAQAPPAEAQEAPAEPQPQPAEEAPQPEPEQPAAPAEEEQPAPPEAPASAPQAEAAEAAEAVQAPQEAAVEEQPAAAPEAEAKPAELPPPLPEGARVYLKVINSPAPELRGARVPLQFDVYGKISVGRGMENVIIAPDPSVSRRHAVIYIEEGRLVIEDLGSTNGTYVYDPEQGVFVKVQKAYLKPGDLVRLGEATVFRVEVEEA